MKLTQLIVSLVVLGLGLAWAADSEASIIATFTVGGSDATMTFTSIDFQCNPAITFAPCPGPAGTGNFSVFSSTGDMSGYTTEGGYDKDLTTGPTQLNTPLLFSNFVTFSGGPVAVPNYQFDLRFINLGVDPQAACGGAAAIGQLCTPSFAALVTPSNPLGLSQFNFQNVDLGGGLIGSTANFTLSGTRRNLTTGEVDDFSALFAMRFTVPYQTVLAAISGGGGAITNSYSGSFTISSSDVSTVPEPGTCILVGSGLLLAVRKRRRVLGRK